MRDRDPNEWNGHEPTHVFQKGIVESSALPYKIDRDVAAIFRRTPAREEDIQVFEDLTLPEGNCSVGYPDGSVLGSNLAAGLCEVEEVAVPDSPVRLGPL